MTRTRQTTNPTGEIIITLESEEKHYSYDQLGVTFDSTNEEILDAVTPVVLEETGVNIKEEGAEGLYTVKKVESSKNTFLFPKSRAAL